MATDQPTSKFQRTRSGKSTIWQSFHNAHKGSTDQAADQPGRPGLQILMMLLPVSLFPFEPFAEQVWTLRDKLSSYEAWYVAVAESLPVPLATLDRRLINSPGPTCEFLSPELFSS